jgi:levansucrase
MTAWSRAQFESHRADSIDRLPLIEDADVVAVADGIDIWDSWPIRTPDGSIADVCGHVVWVALAAPAVGDPGLRHDIAEHRAFLVDHDGSFVDLGPLFSDANALGTRQWAGSTVLDGDRLHAFYTAVGIPGADPPGFRQRPAAATATVECVNGSPRFVEWSTHVEILQPDPERYDTADETSGQPGFIKAFRDPFPFGDPASGERYLLFTGSLPPASSATDFNGTIGIARRCGDALDDWELLDPLVTADGINNELERPHLVLHEGRYYLFFSTQSRTFHPDVIAPTGLYGFVADTALGPYEPLNEHGTVFTNPPARPLQAYSWLVLNDLSVVGFVDAYGVDGETGEIVLTDSRDARRCNFGGTFSPTVHLSIDADRAWLADR